MIDILVKRRNLDTHTRRFLDKEERYQGDVSVYHGMPEIACTQPEARREPWNGGTFTPSQTFEEPVLLLSRSQVSNLQNCEMMNVIVMSPGLWYLIMAALGDSERRENLLKLSKLVLRSRSVSLPSLQTYCAHPHGMSNPCT